MSTRGRVEKSKGGRSRGATQATDTYDTSRFSSKANFKWYSSRAQCKLIVERTIAANVDELCHLREEFVKLGWESILDLQGDYYPTLVREFFANIEDKTSVDFHRIDSYVKGVQITIDEDYLAALLHLRNEGPMFSSTNKAIISDPYYDPNKGEKQLGFARYVAEGKKRRVKMLTNKCDLRERLLIYLFSFNVIPRGGGYNEPRITDIYFMYKMLKGMDGIPGIPLASIIIHSMREAAKSNKEHRNLCFPLVLTKIFRDFQVDLTGEISAKTSSSQIVSYSTVAHLGFVCVNGVWEWHDPKAKNTTVQASNDDWEDDVELEDGEAGPSTYHPLERESRSRSSTVGRMLSEVSQRFDTLESKVEEHGQLLHQILATQEHQFRQLMDALASRPPPP